MALSLANFRTGPGASHLAVLTEHHAAAARLFELLNDPANEQRLVHAEEQDRPPIAGVSRILEADPRISTAMSSRTNGKRFRLAVAMAVKLKMLDLGWSTNGRTGRVDSKWFEKGERFKRPL